MRLVAGTRLGPYEIVSPLGSGGMGEVYRARDTRLGRLVALKILPRAATADPEAVVRFEREARAASALNHPNICTVYDVGVDETPYLAMELLEGETLQTRVTRGPLEISHLVDVGITLADALETAHARGIIHRDIKPGNIFLTARGPKLLDFGLAKTAPVAADAFERTTIPPEARLTGTGSTVGTVAYMSPEQVRGELVDARTDLFSLGVVLYEAATGRPPFHGVTTGVISGSILHTEPPPPRQIRADVPARLEDVILKALEKDRDVRTQTAAELRADLKRLKRHVEPEGPPPARHERYSESREPVITGGADLPQPSSDAQIVVALAKRHRAELATAVIVVIASVVAAYVWTLRRSVPSSAGAPLDLQIVQLTSSGNAERPAISPDGNYVAYVQKDGNDYSLWIRQTTTSSNIRIVSPQPQQVIFGSTVTPDSAYVDFVRGSAREAALWRVPFLGGTPKKIVDPIGSPPGWSADGRHMAFVRTQRLGAETALVIADPDGGNQREILRRRMPAFLMSIAAGPVAIAPNRPSWSSDGHRLALTATSDGSSSEVVIADVETGEEKRLPTKFQAWNLTFAGDGSLLVNSDDGSGINQFWRINVTDGRVSRVINDLTDYAGVSITADARTIVTARSEIRTSIWIGGADGSGGRDIQPPRVDHVVGWTVAWAGQRLLYPTAPLGKIHIMTVGLDSPPQEVVDDAFYPAASPDGRTIVYVRSDFTLMKADSNGHGAVSLQKKGGWPVVSQDGAAVYFVSLEKGIQSVWRLPIAGGEASQVVARFAAGAHPAIPPTGRGCCSDRATTVSRNYSSFAVCRRATSSEHSRPRSTRATWVSSGRWTGKRLPPSIARSAISGFSRSTDRRCARSRISTTAL